MNRSFWLGALALLAAFAVGAGWFAVNAPEASRPKFADLGAVRLDKETPPLPPAPLSRPRDKGYEVVLRRPLFTPPKGAKLGSRRAVGRPTAPEGFVGVRSVLAPVAPPPRSDFREMGTDRAPRDDFQAAFGVDRPRHRQYFGGHLILDEARAADPETPPQPVRIAGAENRAQTTQAPELAPIPRPRPDRSQVAAAPSPGLESVGAATLDSFEPQEEFISAALDPVAEAATRFDSGGAAAIVDTPGLGPEEDIVLLGVLLRRGDDRALIRMASGESRRVTLGDDVAGWRVSSIGEDFIQLRRASQTREIRVPD